MGYFNIVPPNMEGGIQTYPEMWLSPFGMDSVTKSSKPETFVI
jgi:hypothetical protein